MAVLGTAIFKWGIEYKEVVTTKRVSTVAVLTVGPPGAQEQAQIPRDEPPKVIKTKRYVPRPIFESRPLDKVLVDPKCNVGDIRHADFVIDVRYMDFHALNKIRKALEELRDQDKDHPDLEGWNLPRTEEELMKWWMPPASMEGAAPLSTDQATYAEGVVLHSEEVNIEVTPDLTFQKKEVLEYWDAGKKIVVLDRKKVLFSGKNPFNRIPFLSANWWNRSKAFYGMGLGLIVGQNQRVDQGSINAILKILSFGVNPIYLRKRDSNAPTQMIRTGLGKILTVDTDLNNSYKLLETPKVPPEVWAALSESEKATENTSGADQLLVQGSSAGPRSSMGRTAGGASIMAGASATRLDGPLDNFIEQVFKPFLYILDELVTTYLSDAEIFAILGEELGKEYTLDLQQFHDAKIQFEVLAGASLAAKRTMAQSLTLITQIFENPSIQQNLADINGEYIDFKPIVKMWMEASEWKDVNNIIKPLTPEIKQMRAQQTQAAMQQSKGAMAMQNSQQKFQQKAQLQEQSANDRIKRDIIVSAFRNTSQNEATEGDPNVTGLSGGMPDVA